MMPSFIVIGAMKCGTTALHNYLSFHPEVYMSERKELDFFIKEMNWSRGINWYQEQFAPGNGNICGESSQNYTKAHRFQGIPDRIAQYIPDCKFIYLVRDPIERIIAHHIEKVAWGFGPPMTLEKYLQNMENNPVILTSKYAFQLEFFLRKFGRDQLIVIESEALKKDRLNTLNRIFDFLGIDSQNDELKFRTEYNQTSTKIKSNRFGQFIYGKKLEVARKFIPRPIKEVLKEQFVPLTKSKVKREEISNKTKEALIRNLQADVEKLRKMTGQDFSSWCL